MTTGFLLRGASLAACLAAAPAHGQSQHYVVDPMHTFVTFEVLHFGTSTVRARFDRKDGHVLLDRKSGTGQAEITIDTRSVSSGIADFDAHLRSKDFLDVERTPEAKFSGTQFRFDRGRVTAVEGTLTLLGLTQPVALQALRFNCYDSPVLKAEVCGGDFETTIRRSRWGMNWGIDMGIPDEVRLLVQIEAVRR